ncbi:MAG: hypothetical protein R3C12_14660 [Planctomycetaceae bacterium]|nr:hypothetical protein [Planctomycetaceae bacterium]
MKAMCPECDALIPASQINIATDVAFCPNCGELCALSSLVGSQDISPAFDINDPPAGAWFRDDITGWSIGATTRSPIAFFLVPFLCVWSGFSLGGIYGTQIVKGEFDLSMSLFGIPFVLGTFLFGGLAVMTVFGRIEIIVADSVGRLFTGVGPLGWIRRFDWAEVTRIEEDGLGYEYSGSSGRVISLEGKSRLKFGSMLSEQRRYFLLQGLRVLHQRV